MPVGTFKTEMSTSNNLEADLPFSVTLNQNYPNPFNPETIIRFELQNSQNIKLAVYDQLGREVSVLINGRKPSGIHSEIFNAGNLSSGVYFYRLDFEAGALTRKMLLIK